MCGSTADSRSDVDALYRAADVFVFPSFREAGGNVAFEAMGWALPLVVSDIGGPGAAVDDSCGIRVHPSTPDQFARDLASAIDRLADDPELRARLGDGARKRVAAVGLWDAKIDRIDTLYHELVRRRPIEPDPIEPDGVDVAAVIVTHNSAHVIDGLLDSIPAALGRLTADVVVVDNGSTDDTATLVSSRQDCRLVRTTNVGYAAGINRGTREAVSSTAVLVLNPDVRLLPGSIEADVRRDHPAGVGIVAPQSPRRERTSRAIATPRADAAASVGSDPDRNAARRRKTSAAKPTTCDHDRSTGPSALSC